MICNGPSCQGGPQRYRDRDGDVFTVLPDPDNLTVYVHTDEIGVDLSLAQVEALIADLIRMRRELRRVDL